MTCLRGLDLFANNPNAGVAALDLGLRFMIFGTGQLNQRIAAAESARAEAALPITA